MNTLPIDLLKIISQYKTEIDHSTKLKKSLDKVKSIDYKILQMPIDRILRVLAEEDHDDIQLIQLMSVSSIKKYKNKTTSFYWYGGLTMTINHLKMYEIEDETGDNIKYTNVTL